MKYKHAIQIREWSGNNISFECNIIMGNIISKHSEDYVTFMPYDKFIKRDIIIVRKDEIYNEKEDALYSLREALYKRTMKKI